MLINIARVDVGEVNVIPGTIKMVTTDNLATVTAAGYLHPEIMGVQINASDIIETLYSYNVSTGVGTFVVLKPSISNGVITLSISSANIVAARTANIGGAGIGPISVPVSGMTASSIITASIQSSTNAVSIAKLTATATGFDILFSADPGASAIVNYIVFKTAQ